jgi:hypothetical protein
MDEGASDLFRRLENAFLSQAKEKTRRGLLLCIVGESSFSLTANKNKSSNGVRKRETILWARKGEKQAKHLYEGDGVED